MWDLTVPGTNEHDFYVEPAMVVPSTHAGPTAVALLVHNCGDDEQLSLFDQEPYRATAYNGKTLGTLKIDGEEIPLASRGANPKNYIASGHVKGQAALIIRARGVTSGILKINNPNGICNWCTTQLPTLLEDGSTLDVQTPLGTVPRDPTWSNSRIFTGNSQEPRPPS
jgi:Double-stranded DNA deaminase toxin A